MHLERRIMMRGPESADHKTEALGTRTIAGVSAEGTRTTVTIPAGAVGNERPIEIVTETWRSPELKLVVTSNTSDPRFGETRYELRNIVRAEPAPSLFEIPSDYKLLQEPRIVIKEKVKTGPGEGK
jgi:hypothetical protein